ncbi:MAG: 5'-3' exonuclease H3TH domain-containing protein, partial [Patescibacteria group bacterium]
MPTHATRNETALLIDANALIHRAWHALPPLTAPDGRLVNAAYGFASVLLKVLASERPTYLGVCWDTPEPTYRHEAKPEYKAQREEQPEEFYAQIPLVKEIVTAFGGTNIELPGYEADDILATCATRLAAIGVKVTLLTSDKDAWQMIGPDIRVVAFKKGVSETVTYDEKVLKDVTGLTPPQIVDYKALAGDPSDNLSGVKGIGDKTATDLLMRFGDLDGIFVAAQDTMSELTPSVRKKLLEGEQEARSTYPIVRLVTDAPIGAKVEDLRRRIVDEKALTSTFLDLGFKTLLDRALGTKHETNGAESRSVEKPKTKRGASIKHLLSPTDEEVLSALAVSSDEKRLIIRAVADPRASLFRESPAIAIGTLSASLLLTGRHLKSTDVRTKLGKVLKDASIAKVGHGLKDVWHWSNRDGLELKGIAFDVGIASYLVAGGEGDHDLASIASEHAEMTFTDAEDRPLQEVDAIRACEPALAEALATQGLERVFCDIEMPLIPVLAAMEAVGIRIDRKRLSRLSEEFRGEKARLEREMEEFAGEPFNAGSPQ